MKWPSLFKPKIARYGVRYMTDSPELAAQIDRYIAWFDRFQPDGVFDFGPAMELVDWVDPEHRPLLWTEAVNPRDPHDVYGWHLCALNAVPHAFEVDAPRVQRAGWAVGCIWYVRAAHRGRGIGRGIWQATCQWLQLNAPGIQYVVWEPPLARLHTLTRHFGGFIKVPRHRQDTPQLFFPTSAASVLGRDAELLVDLEDTPDAGMFAQWYPE